MPHAVWSWWWKSVTRFAVLNQPSSGTAFLAFSLLLCPLTASAQSQSKDAPEITTETVPTTFKVRVNQVLLRVVVTDEHGQAVGNLNREDFSVYDRGKPQIIGGFSVDRTNKKKDVVIQGKPSAPIVDKQIQESSGPTFAERHIVYVLDDRHAEFADLVPIKRAIEHQLENIVGPTDRVAIRTTSNRVQLDFTDDRAQISATLARIQPHALHTSAFDCPYMSYYLADQILNRDDSMALQSALDEYQSCSGGAFKPALSGQSAPGGAGRQSNAGGGGGRCHTPRASVDPDLIIVCQKASDALAMGDFETRDALRMLNDTVNRLRSTVGRRSIVFISPGFHMRDQYQDLENLFESASHSGVIIHTLDVRGVWTDTGYSAEARLAPSTGNNYRRESALDEGEILGEIAEATGGVWFRGNNDMDLGVRRTSQAPEYTYLLAFSPQNLKLDGSFHKLKVTLKHPGRYTIVARRGYYAPRASADRKETARREIEEALFSQEESREIPIRVHTEFFRTSNDAARVSVVSKIDLRPVVFRREEDRNRGQLTLVTGIFDRNGKLVSGEQKLIELRLKDQTFKDRLRNGAVMKSSFDLKPGAYQVRVVVRDGEGQQLSASNAVVAIP